jgi:two-component system sensor histidine kinase/response regulator
VLGHDLRNPLPIGALLLSHIFDPFRGGDRPSNRHEGLGLGLYIVQQIVMAHGGTIDVISHNRTTFAVHLPRY